MPRVYNIRDKNLPPHAILVDRSTPYGNPFTMHAERNRDAVCDKFEEYAEERNAREPGWLAALRDADLVCHCKPKRCHGDTILRLANS